MDNTITPKNRLDAVLIKAFEEFYKETGMAVVEAKPRWEVANRTMEVFDISITASS